MEGKTKERRSQLLHLGHPLVLQQQEHCVPGTHSICLCCSQIRACRGSKLKHFLIKAVQGPAEYQQPLVLESEVLDIFSEGVR